MKEKSLINSPIWDEIGNALKPLLRLSGAQFGVFMLDKDGACAAIMVGEETMDDPRRMRDSLRMFKERLAEMEEKADNEELDFSKGNQKFIRETDTGKFKPIPPPED